VAELIKVGHYKETSLVFGVITARTTCVCAQVPPELERFFVAEAADEIRDRSGADCWADSWHILQQHSSFCLYTCWRSMAYWRHLG